MSLNDPFGRVARRQEAAYLALREQLRQQGVATEQAAHAARRRLQQTGLRVAAIVIGIALLAAMLAPGLRAVIGILTLLILVWLASSFVQTRAHLSRYQRELSAAQAVADNHRQNAEEQGP
ncbi:MAG: hypothetical protein QNJ91_10055 [Gammaproteobacteria bacterium]|nr:hypothetical protein [Gammaproteobacteria bacterium]